MRTFASFAVLGLLLLGLALHAQENPAPAASAAPPAGPNPAPASIAQPPAQAYAATEGKQFHVDDKFANLPENPAYPIDQPDGLVPPFPRPKWCKAAETAMRTGRHDVNFFAPEPRDVFRHMDQVMTKIPGTPPTRQLRPLDFGVKPGVYDQNNPGQQAIYGRNSWLLWCGGNEDFWDFLAHDEYAILDFLAELDSRKRSSRLRDLGLINQPGMKGSDQPGPYGLYLDVVEKRIGEDDPLPGEAPLYSTPKPPRPTDPDELESDGVNPAVYGYPSGVIGMRLFKNPKFDDPKAKAWWNPKAFYEDPAYAADSRTIRPLRVGMSCAICHVCPHPLNLPENPEEPKWENLSSIIGNQYFRTSTAFANRLQPGSFLWHYVASQQPGTIDTSMVSTDNINNANAMNPVFELPARQLRANLNPPETLDPISQTIPGNGAPDRLIARVLMAGEDSIGITAALERVYLNIGTYHDEWERCSNLLIGFAPTKPFSIEACRSNSVYWRANEDFRIPFEQQFFLWDKRDPQTGERLQCSTNAMLLGDALVPEGGKRVRFADAKDPKYRKYAGSPEQELLGLEVFTDHCMVCHSSKQPDGYRLAFAQNPPSPAKKWKEVPAGSGPLTMPYSFEHWEEFKASPAYEDYVRRARTLTGKTNKEKAAFFREENYLSTDLRVPVSLVESNAGRAVATNAVEGQVWSEFASETYKHLPPVGRIHYWDPFSKSEKTWQPKGGGPGYYRVASLVGIWATAPLLHNNALGKFIPDDQLALRVSVEGRLEMFEDAIRKLLWKDLRGRTPSGELGLRTGAEGMWHGSDPGWIFRTDQETEVRFPRGHIRRLITGVLPGILPGFLGAVATGLLDHPWVAPLFLALLGLALLVWSPRWFFYLATAAGLILALTLAISGLHYLLPWFVWLLPVALLIGALGWIVTHRSGAPNPPSTTPLAERCFGHIRSVAEWTGVAAYALLVMVLFVGLLVGRAFVNGELGDLRFGPIPKGIPVNAFMNLDPAASLGDKLAAGRGLLATIGALQADDRRPYGKRMNDAQRLEIFDREAGPALMKASKCPDWVLDRGHYFGESLSSEEKEALIVFLRTL